MSENRVVLDDQKLLDLYKKFQNTRGAFGEIYPVTKSSDFFDSGSYHGSAMPAVLQTGEQVATAANALNRFCYDLHAITAWNKVFDCVTEEEKFLALYEFLYPIASDCLSAPYAIKQMFVTSVCQVSHHTRCFDNWHEAPLKKQLNFDDVERLAKKSSSWPALRAALALLNDDSFKNASDDYRNQLNHGFPRRIEIGHTWGIKRVVEPDKVTYSLSDIPPLRVGDLIPLLADQHKIALKCYGAYTDLIKEQCLTWPRT